MRIGVHLGPDQINVTSVDEKGRVTSTTELVGAESPSATAHLRAFTRALDALQALWERTPARGSTPAPVSRVRRVSVDVGALLDTPFLAADSGTPVPPLSPPVLVRLAPRPPIDRAHELRSSAAGLETARIVHLQGGHTALGEELATLDVDAAMHLAHTLEPGARIIVTSVGSLANAQHELAVGKVLLTAARPAEVSYSHAYFSTSFATRERTAMVNSALTPRAARLATDLADLCRQRFPQARQLVSTNDGGCTPLSRLSVAPVHSLTSFEASKIVGAAAVLGQRDGKLLLDDAGSSLLGQLRGGVPVVGSRYSQTAHGVLATRGALHWPLSHERAMEWAGARHGVRSAGALAALGAACAPVSEWVNAMATVKTEQEHDAALLAAQHRAQARLVSVGYSPAAISVAESRAEAATFGHPNIVAIRVRAVADAFDVPLLSREDTP